MGVFAVGVMAWMLVAAGAPWWVWLLFGFACVEALSQL